MDRRRHGRRWRSARFGAALGVWSSPVASRSGLALSVARLCADRARRRRVGHVAAGAARHRGTAPDRRAAAATITWLMMIVGIAVTASQRRRAARPLFADAAAARSSAWSRPAAVVMTCLAVLRASRARDWARGRAASRRPRCARGCARSGPSRGRAASRSSCFLSMTAYFMQELILEPYAGLVFGFTPGQSHVAVGRAERRGVSRAC